MGLCSESGPPFVYCWGDSGGRGVLGKGDTNTKGILYRGTAEIPYPWVTTSIACFSLKDLHATSQGSGAEQGQPPISWGEDTLRYRTWFLRYLLDQQLTR